MATFTPPSLDADQVLLDRGMHVGRPSSRWLGVIMESEALEIAQ